MKQLKKINFKFEELVILDYLTGSAAGRGRSGELNAFKSRLLGTLTHRELIKTLQRVLGRQSVTLNRGSRWWVWGFTDTVTGLDLYLCISTREISFRVAPGCSFYAGLGVVRKCVDLCLRKIVGDDS